MYFMRNPDGDVLLKRDRTELVLYYRLVSPCQKASVTTQIMPPPQQMVPSWQMPVLSVAELFIDGDDATSHHVR